MVGWSQWNWPVWRQDAIYTASLARKEGTKEARQKSRQNRRNGEILCFLTYTFSMLVNERKKLETSGLLLQIEGIPVHNLILTWFEEEVLLFNNIGRTSQLVGTWESYEPKKRHLHYSNFPITKSDFNHVVEWGPFSMKLQRYHWKLIWNESMGQNVRWRKHNSLVKQGTTWGWRVGGG